MTQEHPITPPPELVQQWWDGTHGAFYEFEAIATKAARWGADQELEACVEWMGDSPVVWRGDPEEHPGFYLREARRPKPPSLKEQALQALYRFDDTEGHEGLTPEQIAEDFVLIRRAIESLPD